MIFIQFEFLKFKIFRARFQIVSGSNLAGIQSVLGRQLMKVIATQMNEIGREHMSYNNYTSISIIKIKSIYQITPPHNHSYHHH